MRYQAEPGNEGSLVTRGKGREKSEAEPLDMRYQAEPGNERIFIFLTPPSTVISH